MSRSISRTLPAAAALVAVLALGAWGGGDDEQLIGTPAQSGDGGGANVTEKLFAGTAADNRANPTEGAKKGGKLTVLSSGDVDYMDPGKTYYSYAIGIMNAIDRGLYARDGRTVTVKLKSGVTFSKPVSREVTSKDVKYAIERAFTGNVANGYAGIYFRDVVGAPKDKGTGAALAGALAMPISIPVPKEYAEKYDKETPSTYGEGHAVYTGPYMVESDADGKRPATSRASASTSCAIPTTPRSTTSASRTWTRSRSSRATTTPPSRRAGSSRARAWRRATSSRRRASSSGCSSPTSPSCRRCRAAAGA